MTLPFRQESQDRGQDHLLALMTVPSVSSTGITATLHTGHPCVGIFLSLFLTATQNPEPGTRRNIQRPCHSDSEQGRQWWRSRVVVPEWQVLTRAVPRRVRCASKRIKPPPPSSAPAFKSLSFPLPRRRRDGVDFGPRSLRCSCIRRSLVV